MAQTFKEVGKGYLRRMTRLEESAGSKHMGEDGRALSSSFQTLTNFSILGLMVDEDLKSNLFPTSGI